MSVERVDMVKDCLTEREETVYQASNMLSTTPSVLSESTLPDFSSFLLSASPSLPSIVFRNIEQLVNIALDFSALLTETTEQIFSVRSSLETTVETLRMCRHSLWLRRAPSITPRLAIAGSQQSGKTTVFDFLFQGNVGHIAGDTVFFSPPESSSVGVARDGKVNVSLYSSKISTSARLEPSPISFVDNQSMHNFSEGGVLFLRRTASSRIGTVGIVGADKKEDVGGSLFPSPVIKNDIIYHYRNLKPDVKTEVDDIGAQDVTHLPSLHRSGSRRNYRGDEGLTNRLSLKSAQILSFPDWRKQRSLETDTVLSTLSSVALRAVTIFPGMFDRTIVDLIQEKRGDIMLNYSKQNPENLFRQYDKASILKRTSSNLLSTRMSSSHTFVSFRGLTSGTFNAGQAASWVLWETINDIVRSEKEEMSSCFSPDSISADAIFFTVPCDVVGTHRMSSCISKLFGIFGTRNVGSQRDGSNSGTATLTPWKQRYMHENYEEDCVQNVRQLISDMTFFVLTFSDAILARAEGILPVDEHLPKRPPPMSTSLSELITLFQRDMLQHFGVHVDSWQVIPFSGVMSRVTRDALTVLYEARMSNYESVEMMSDSLSKPSTSSLPGVPNSSSTATTALVSSGAGGLSLQTAINSYCDVVFGQRFNERKHSLTAEQLKEMVWRHALTSLWQDSGAYQLLSTVRLFEWSSVLHFISHTAVSLVIWCEQMRGLIPQVRKALRSRLTRSRTDLKRVKRINNRVEGAVKKLKEESSPRFFFESMLSQLQERFEEFTISFWWNIWDFFEMENERCGLLSSTAKSFSTCTQFSRKSSSALMSSSILKARERLRREYHQFLTVYVDSEYERQISQLQHIIEEKNRLSAKPTFSQDDNDDNDDNNTEMEKEEENLVSDIQVAAMALSMTSPAHALSLLEDARHHIPFVAQKAQELKIAMRKELSLQVARLNTEVINYFMAELEAVLPEFVEICEDKRKAAKTELLEVVNVIDFSESYDEVERRLLNLMLNELSHLRLVGMQPRQELQAFVTGLRRALCEDQVGLYAECKGRGGNKRHIGCSVKTTAYLEKSMRESQLQQIKPFEFIQSSKPFVLRPTHESEVTYLAPMEMTEVMIMPVSDDWMHRCMSVGLKETLPHCVTSTNKATTDGVNKEEELKKAEPSEDSFSGVIMEEKNPLWFLLAVWQKALSVMSFSPWLQLQSVRYASLLNNITFIFLKGHDRFDAALKKEDHELRLLVQSLQKELSRVRMDIPTSLKRLSNTANSVAREVKCAKAETIGAML